MAARRQDFEPGCAGPAVRTRVASGRLPRGVRKSLGPEADSDATIRIGRSWQLPGLAIIRHQASCAGARRGRTEDER